MGDVLGTDDVVTTPAPDEPTVVVDLRDDGDPTTGPDRPAQSGTPDRRRTWIGRAIVVAATAAVFATVVLQGYGVSGGSLETAWQLVDLEVLADNPVTATWYLHTQPPLHNLVVGIVAWSPLPLAGTLFVLYAAAYAAMGLALHDLLVRWGLGPVAAGVVVAVALTQPSLVKTVHIASYEVPVAMLIVGALWAVQRHLDEPRLRWLLAASTMLTLAALTRSLMHPLWVLAVVALVLTARRVPARHAAAALAIPVVLLGGWMLKNAALFGTPTTSSWFGFNAQRGVTGPMNEADVRAAVEDGTVSSLALEVPWEDLDAYPAWTGDCEPRHDHPAVAAPHKNAGTAVEIANFNAECYLPVYDRAQHDAVAMVRRSPGRYAATRVPALVLTFRQADFDWRAERTWLDAVHRPLLLDTRYDVDMRDWSAPLFPVDRLTVETSLTLMACAVAVTARGTLAAARLARRWRTRGSWPAHEVVWLVAGSVVVVVVVGSSLLELGENFRFRSTIDPLLVALPLAAVVRRAGELRRRAHDADATA